MTPDNGIEELKKISSEMLNVGTFPDFLSVLFEGAKQNIEITISKARELYFDSRYSRSEGMICPSFVLDFIVDYFKNLSPAFFLCPWSRKGLDFLYLVEKIKPKKSLGISYSDYDYNTAKFLDKNSEVEWVNNDVLEHLDENKFEVDAIYGFVPWKMEQKKVEFDFKGESVTIHDHSDNLVLLAASELLKEDGVGFFIVPNNFHLNSRKNSVLKNLSKFGLYIDALFTIPRGTFSPITPVSAQLLVIKRKEPVNLFVGELSPNQSTNEVLLQNYLDRKEGKIPSLGALVKPDLYRSLDVLKRELNILEYVTSGNLEEYPMSHISTLIKRTNLKDPDAFQDIANSVFLPLIGNSLAMTSKGDMTLKAHNYAQIVLKPDLAISEYVAQFYNSNMGHELRGMLKTGATIPKISTQSLLRSSIYLPDLRTQTNTVKTKSLIDDLQTQLEIFQAELFNFPRKAEEIYDQVNQLNQQDSFENWIDTLPFPLASILWAYHTIPSPKEKVERLVNFFEALAIFHVSVSLSAYSSNQSLYSQYSPAWTENMDDLHLKFRRASFGDWTSLAQRIAKKTRILINESETEDLCYELFGKPSKKFMQMISSRKLLTVMQSAVEYRNSWLGHGGMAGGAEWANRLILIQKTLSETKKTILNIFESCMLVSPGKMEYNGGVYNQEIKVLMGSRTPFKWDSLESTIPMDRNKLYLIHKDHNQPLELLPFIRFFESPQSEQNACYFYNSMSSGGARWVSYHFSVESEIIQPDTDLENALALLSKKEQET